jgi:SAM-dependent methyltransferase
MVLDAVQLLSIFRPEQFDLVISTEMLEHCENWRDAINQMKTALKPGGYLFLTARSPGFDYHNPPDYWRFTLDHFKRIISDFDILSLEKDSESPGVLAVAAKPASWYPTDLNTIQPYPA